MEIEIIIFKNSGKYYTSDTVKNDKDIWLFEQEFKDFVIVNLPAKLSDGYIMVRDTSDNQSFHTRLYTYNQLFC